MRDSTWLVVVVALTMAETAVSKPLWSTLTADNYLYPTSEVNAQPQYLAAYHNAHSPYYVYNVHANLGGLPGTILTNGQPEVSHVPTYGFYYGTPVYDFQIPLSPIYPVLTSSYPGFPPVLPPSSTPGPFDENDDDDGIEKLDSKIDPNMETKKPGGNEQNSDSIIVDAI